MLVFELSKAQVKPCFGHCTIIGHKITNFIISALAIDIVLNLLFELFWETLGDVRVFQVEIYFIVGAFMVGRSLKKLEFIMLDNLEIHKMQVEGVHSNGIDVNQIPVLYCADLRIFTPALMKLCVSVVRVD